MAAFYNIVHMIQSQSEASTMTAGNFDIISNLPVEISTSIFRMLDPISMLAAMQVSSRWYRLYRDERPLRRALKKKVKERRQRNVEFIHNFSVRPTDPWYRNDLPIARPRLTASVQATKKRKRASTKHQDKRAKLLRI